MAAKRNKELQRLRNTRDFRAEMLVLAGELVGNRLNGRLTVVDPVVSEATLQEEWDRLLPALAPDVRTRMTLAIERGKGRAGARGGGSPAESDALLLDRPNYRYEVLRLLVGSSLENDGPGSVKGIVEAIGASLTPIRRALADLRQADLLRSWGRGIEVDAEDVSAELMARIGAMPQTLRFRFERGAQIKPPAKLLERALPLLGPSGPPGWEPMALSGIPVAQADVPKLDLMGMPRLDLVAHVPRDERTFDAALLRLLDDGLEPEPSVLAPAPVVVTLVRAERRYMRDAGLGPVRCAHPMDVFLSLLDMGLREQALQYAKKVRE